MAEPEGTTAEPAAPETTENGNPLEERLTSFMDEVRGELGGLKETLTAPPEDEYGYDPGYGQPGPAQQSPYGAPGQYGMPTAPQYGEQPYVPPGHVLLYDGDDNPIPVPAELAQQALGQPGVSQQPGYPQQPDPNQLQQLAPALAEALGIPDLQAAVERREMLDRVSAYEQQYPELKSEQVYKPAADAARAKADQMGRPDLAADPDFVVMNWLADRAATGAASGTPAGAQPGIQLEPGGGATPEAEPADPAQAIVDAVRGRNPFGS